MGALPDSCAIPQFLRPGYGRMRWCRQANPKIAGKQEFLRAPQTNSWPQTQKVPERGFEPPPTCVDMDLNHARLPIPRAGVSHLRWQNHRQFSRGESLKSGGLRSQKTAKEAKIA